MNEKERIVSDHHPPCPQCGGKVLPGTLRTAAGVVQVDSCQSTRSSALTARICLSCGYVELYADNRERLAYQDISSEDLDQVRGEGQG